MKQGGRRTKIGKHILCKSGTPKRIGKGLSKCTEREVNNICKLLKMVVRTSPRTPMWQSLQHYEKNHTHQENAKGHED